MTYKSERTGVDRWYMWWPAVRAMPEVQLNYGYSAKLHCDKNNLGPSFIIGWGLAQDERSLKNPARFVNSFFFWKFAHDCKDELVRLMRQDSEYIMWGHGAFFLNLNSWHGQSPCRFSKAGTLHRGRAVRRWWGPTVVWAMTIMTFMV